MSRNCYSVDTLHTLEGSNILCTKVEDFLFILSSLRASLLFSSLSLCFPLSSLVPYSPSLSLSPSPLSSPSFHPLFLFLFAFLPHVLRPTSPNLPSCLPQVVGTVVDLFDTLEFINNTSPQDEAALHLLSFGQVRLQRGLDMTFAGNIGRCEQDESVI